MSSRFFNFVFLSVFCLFSVSLSFFVLVKFYAVIYFNLSHTYYFSQESVFFSVFIVTAFSASFSGTFRRSVKSLPDFLLVCHHIGVITGRVGD